MWIRIIHTKTGSRVFYALFDGMYNLFISVGIFVARFESKGMRRPQFVGRAVGKDSHVFYYAVTIDFSTVLFWESIRQIKFPKMKKFLFIFLMAFSGMVYAQDTIALANKQTILCKILEVGSSEIKYKKWSNPEGPTYTTAISDILSISYQNGEKEDLMTLQFFTKESPIQNSQTVAAQNASIQSIHTNIDYLKRDELLHRSRGCRIAGIIFFVVPALC